MTIEELYELMKQGFDRIENRLDSIDTRLRNVETNVAWIKGKLEGTQEGNQASVWQIITTATAVGAVIIAVIAQGHL